MIKKSLTYHSSLHSPDIAGHLAERMIPLSSTHQMLRAALFKDDWDFDSLRTGGVQYMATGKVQVKESDSEFGVSCNRM